MAWLPVFHWNRSMKERTGGRAAAAGFPRVSVLIPARDAAATIAMALDSVLSQEYAGPVEVIVADGSGSPAMSEMIRRRYPTVKLVPNPDRELLPGITKCLRAATGGVIARCDAHTFFAPGYLRRAVESLRRTGAANVGGRQRPVGTTFFERAVAMAMITPLGAGDARYRIGGPAGPADTVYLGVFRREALDAVGGYNVSLVGNEDYELNYRLRKRGETVWFDPELAVDYRPRGTLRALARQYFRYGRMKGAMSRQHPASLRPRHFAAPLLVLGLVASGFLALAGAPRVAASALPLVYVLVLAIGSLAVGLRRRSHAALLLPVVLATMHLAWGLGFFLPFRRQRWGNRAHRESRPRQERGENGVAGPGKALRRTPDDAEALE